MNTSKIPATQDIINLSPDELYTKAVTYKQNGDINNYCMYMTMAANYDHELAKQDLDDDYHNDLVHLKQNYSITLQFYEATKDYGYSANYLGYIYGHGNSGTNKNTDTANKLYELGVIFGNMYAMANLGLSYAGKDNAKAKELYELAANKGNCRAMNLLGNMYYKDKNYIKARELYEKAMRVDKGTAMQNLEKLYLETDMKKDIEYTVNYFKSINKADVLIKIYKSDQYVKDILMENIKLYQQISDMKKSVVNNTL